MVKLLQVTDPHIGATEDYRLAGVDTRRSFDLVLAQAQQEEPDLLLLTGDNAGDCSEPAYRHFFARVKQTGLPFHWLPGNHDRIEVAEQSPGATPFQRSIEIGNWNIIMLDSVIPRSPNGRLGEVELDALDRELSQNSKDHVLICLHHHPVLINCAWLDQQIVADAREFFEILDSYSEVRGVIWGHIHQEFNSERNGVKLHSCPSTCIQFKPNSDDFALDDAHPGYRVIELTDEGEIKTLVRRVEIPDLGVDHNCLGYE